MRARSCPRLWEAEAAEDGRLDPTTLASFDRHASTCAACACERATFAHLRALADHLPLPRTTPLDRKRLRATILRNGNRAVMTAVSARPAWLVPTSVLLVSLAILAGLGFSTRRRAVREVSSMVSSIAFEVTPIGVARWTVDREGADAQIALSEGSLSVHVAKLSSGQHFLLVLPDGQIEVRGTRFVAHVDRGHTRDVSVSEGTVALRLAASRERLLHTGESWSAEPDETAVEAAPSSMIDANRPDPPGPHGDKPSSRQPQSGQPREVSAGAAFSDAMSAFSAGAYETADALFAQFQQKFPADARNEDAEFLRIVIEKRLGDRAATSRRARAYLEHYPRGFRRNDVERLIW
jgi:hypothetical protein